MRPLNPFEPHRPVSPEQFIGREKELAELDAALEHLRHGRPRHFLITGFRGVGKTSFLDLIRSHAGRGANKFNFLVLDFLINKRNTCFDLAKGIERELTRAVSDYDPFAAIVQKSWGFIQRIEAAGISLKSAPAQVDHREIYEAVADAMCETVEKLCGRTSLVYGYDGVLLLLDEVDQASAELDLGAFLKYLLEILNRRGCHRVSIGLAGLSSSRDVLLKSHPSSLRIFDELTLGDLNREEFDQLLDEAQFKVQSDGEMGFVLEKSARDTLFDYLDGHPHFVHQFGYCAFEYACAKPEGFITLTGEDVIHGAINVRGAFDLIGDMYFRSDFEVVESNDLALRILDFIGESPRQAFSTYQLSAKIECLYEDLITVLRKMCELKLLVEENGKYRIRYTCFAYWLKAMRPQLVS